MSAGSGPEVGVSMKALKIVAVVLGALLLLTGIGLLAGSAAVGIGQSALDDELAKSGLAGPVQGNVTAVNQGVYTVWYTDKNGVSQTGRGPSANGTGTGTEAPQVGDTVSVYYSTTDPSQIVILNIPGGGLAGIAGGLRTIGIVCLAVGAILLLARDHRPGRRAEEGRRRRAGLSGRALPPGQAYPDQPGPPAGYPQQPPPGYPQQPPPGIRNSRYPPAAVPAARAIRSSPGSAAGSRLRGQHVADRRTGCHPEFTPQSTRPSRTWTADRVPITPDLNPPGASDRIVRLLRRGRRGMPSTNEAAEPRDS